MHRFYILVFLTLVAILIASFLITPSSIRAIKNESNTNSTVEQNEQNGLHKKVTLITGGRIINVDEEKMYWIALEKWGENTITQERNIPYEMVQLESGYMFLHIGNGPFMQGDDYSFTVDTRIRQMDFFQMLGEFYSSNEVSDQKLTIEDLKLEVVSYPKSPVRTGDGLILDYRRLQ